MQKFFSLHLILLVRLRLANIEEWQQQVCLYLHIILLMYRCCYRLLVNPTLGTPNVISIYIIFHKSVEVSISGAS